MSSENPGKPSSWQRWKLPVSGLSVLLGLGALLIAFYLSDRRNSDPVFDTRAEVGSSTSSQLRHHVRWKPAEREAVRDSTPQVISKSVAERQPNSVFGLVVDGTGEPVENATVRLSLRDGKAPSASAAMSNSAGVFRTPPLSEGRWRIAVGASGYHSDVQSIQVPQTSELRVILKEDPGIEILVTNALGEAVKGAQVTLRSRTDRLPGKRSGVSSDEGMVKLRGAATTDADWRGRLEVSHHSYLAAELVVTAKDFLGGPFRILIEEFGECRGRVLSAAGDPVAGAQVYVTSRQITSRPVTNPKDLRQKITGKERTEPTDTQRLSTTSTGEFHFRKLRPGRSRIVVTTREHGYAVLKDVLIVREDGREPLEIRLSKGAGTISGRVETTDGNPAVLCPVRLVPVANQGESPIIPVTGTLIESVTDQDGRFEFAGLPLQRFDLHAGGAKFTHDTRRSVAAGEDATLHVDLPGSIGGTVDLAKLDGYAIRLMRTDQPQEDRSLSARTLRSSSTRRTFTIRDVPGGTYTVAVVVGGEVIAQVDGVIVRAGERTEDVRLGAPAG